MEVRIEGLRHPMGLDEEKPRFSFVIQAAQGAKRQDSYQVVVRDAQKTVWDSGVVMGEQMQQIAYEGESLKPYTGYTVEVSCIDDIGNVYSGSGSFETGKLGAAMKGDYITASFRTAVDLEQENVDDWLRPVVFRKRFTCAQDVEKARLYVSSMGINSCTINGKAAGDCYFAPGWTAHEKLMQYYVLDIGNLLRTGDNVIEITVSNGWYNRKIFWVDPEQQGKFSNDLAAVAYLRIEDGKEKLAEVMTDESWTCGYGNILMGGLYDGEVYDARIEPELDEPVRLAGYDKSVLTGPVSETVRAIERLSVKDIFQTPSGETILDVGENIAGVPVLKLEGKAGDKVVLEFGEVLDKSGNFYNGNLVGAACRYEYTLKDGFQEYTPVTTYYGFRYVKVVEFPGQPGKANFEFAVLCSDMRQTGTFHCDHEDINQLHRNICRSMKGNYIDIPTDCPQRDERLGWTADAQEFLSTACFLYDVSPFFKKWLRDLALEQGEKGAVPDVVPNVNFNAALDGQDLNSAHIPDGLARDNVNWAVFWGDAATICPQTLYTWYDDKRILQNQLCSMERWCDFLYAQFTSPEGIYLNNQCGDWVALDAKDGAYLGATPLDYVTCACMLHSIDLMVRTSEILGAVEAAEKWRVRHKSAFSIFKERYCTVDGVIKPSTQTAKIMALKYDLIPNKVQQARELAEQIRADGTRLIVGFIGIAYILEVLSENGYTDLAYDLLLREEYPSWLYQVKKGATSVWEHLDGIREDGSFWSEEMNSFNHYAYGSVGEWIYSRVGGIRVDPAHPGFKHFTIQPLPHPDITAAEAAFESIYGEISCRWQCGDGVFKLKVVVPFNTSATIVLPSGKTEVVDCGGYQYVEPIVR